ncbi:endogenous retrovirus group K member 8 Gag polyprotein-like [Talpa occidentalis]|uniref:endogenous retrovirus group K member 8 Gag polyprotein-like n=1 Tax=Talpa occidentalis TaxID=50954 RepID=UPI0023F81CE6|nr:endogenous retrovirus group K member 8 Gag polyprotein-like [Talpa occidentalis]
MGNTMSKGQLVRALQLLLKHYGTPIKVQTLHNLVSVLANTSKWFLQQDTVSVQNWEKVKADLLLHRDLYGPQTIPPRIFSLWQLVHDALSDGGAAACELVAEALRSAAQSESEKPATYSATASSATETPPSQSSKLGGDSSSDEGDVEDNTDHPPPYDRPPPSTKNRRYPSPHTLPSAPPLNSHGSDPDLPGLIQSLTSVLSRFVPSNSENSRESLLAGLVSVVQNAQGQAFRQHSALPFRDLKLLKESIKDYGLQSPFVHQMLDTFETFIMTPNDWKDTFRAVLSPGDYLLWKGQFTELCDQYAQTNLQRGFPQQTKEMLTGEGPHYSTNQQQCLYNPAVFAQVALAAKSAWKALGSRGQPHQSLTKILQGPSEPFADFVARLLTAASRIMGEGEPTSILVKQLAFENANKWCQEAIRPWKDKQDISGYIRLCKDIDGATVTGTIMAAALQPSAQHATRSGTCFGCGQTGHFRNECPSCPNSSTSRPQRGALTRPRSPGPCPRCKKGLHWANECRSKFDVTGSPITPFRQSNSRGTPRPQAPLSQGPYNQVPPPVSYHLPQNYMASQTHLPTLPSYQGANPRGLIPNHIWQMDVTHIPHFGRQSFVHVSIDTHSHLLFASPHSGEATKDVISHLWQALAYMGRPRVIKTDNGLAYASRSFASFCSDHNITHITGIPYNPQGQALVEHAHQHLKNQIQKQSNSTPPDPHIRLSRALFTINFASLDTQTKLTRAEVHWQTQANHSIRSVVWKEPHSLQWQPPAPVLAEAPGSLCIFPPGQPQPRWIPLRLTCLLHSLPSDPPNEEALSKPSENDPAPATTLPPPTASTPPPLQHDSLDNSK